MLSNIDMDEAYTHYLQRVAAHNELEQFFQSQNVKRYAELALGITRPEGNYSAAEHQLGPMVLGNNSTQSVFNLATQLFSLSDAHHVPLTIYQANMPYLRISLGSEMAMMLNPEKYWVGNVRTIYSHLLLKHNGNQQKADEELQLYREPDGARPSEMEYRIWRDLYLSLENSLKNIAEMGDDEATKQGTSSGQYKFMWSDAICSMLYSSHA